MRGRKNEKFAVIDLETSQWVRTICWGYKSWNTREAFIDKTSEANCLDALLKIILDDEAKIVWAHNGGKFDWLMFLHYVQSTSEWKIKASVKAGRIIFAEVRHITDETRFFSLYDSYAVAQASLKKCVKDFDLKNTKALKDEDYKIDAMDWSDDRLRSGVLADVDALYELIEVLSEQFDSWGGRLKATFSSSAMSVLKKKVGRLPHIPPPVNTIVRDAYFGGRVEVFHHLPQYTVAEWDINSSYPASMVEALPWHFLHHTVNKISMNKLIDGEDENEAIIRCQVKVPFQPLPVLPFRPKTGGVYFPYGGFTGWFTVPELSYARFHGFATINPIEAYVYTSTKALKPYIEELYTLKQTSTGAKKEFVKLCLNGSYGKFGQRPEVETLQCIPDANERDRFIMSSRPGTVTSLHQDGPWVSIEDVRWPKHTHYALASYVTAYSRIRLHEHMRKANKLAYVDTDSVHADTASGFPTSKRLGDLSLKQDNVQRAVYFAPKIYSMTHGKETSYKSKGFPVNEEDFYRVVTGKEVTRKRMKLFKSMLRDNTGPLHHGTQLPLDVKSWAQISPKRRASLDGTTEPWSARDLLHEKHLTQLSPAAIQHLLP